MDRAHKARIAFGMARKVTFVPLHQLPLFVDDLALGAALLGEKRAREWPAIAQILEQRGLPKIDALMGGRYTPAVRAFFDFEYGLTSAAPSAPDGDEHPGAFSRSK